MKRYSVFILCLLFISLIGFPAFSHANSINTEKDFKELEEQFNQLKEEFKKEQEEDFYKEDIFQILLENEQDSSSNLYNFITIFVVIITLFVTLAGIILTILLTKLKKHQEKINLVLDSKEFDDKITQIETRLIEMRLKERNQIKLELTNKFKHLINKTNGHIEQIESVRNGEIQLDENIDIEGILEKYEYDYLKSTVSSINSSFRITEDIDLMYEDDEEKDVVNPEEELESWYTDLYEIYEKLRTIHWNELIRV